MPGELLDKAGADFHQSGQREADFVRRVREELERKKVSQEVVPTISLYVPTVTVAVKETHDGEDCGCIDQERTMAVSDTIRLIHTCHDGRVDVVEAKILSIDFPVEHATIS